jgi:hypothetical protein
MGIDAEMFIKTKIKFTDKELKRLAYELASSFGAERFFIDRDKKWEGQHCLNFIDKYEQDSPITIYPKAKEFFINVNLGTRYYGVGYERGDLPFIISVTEWLEYKIPNCEVWYGGDSSGIEAIHFNAVERKKLFTHFVNLNHAPYLGHFDGEHKEWCEFCEEPMLQYGFGGTYSAFRCTGCNFKFEIRNGIKKQLKDNE